MATITTTTRKILDSAGNLANGVIYFTQTDRYVTSTALVTTATGQAVVRDGEFARTLVIPTTPASEYVKVVEVFGPNPATRVPVTWYTHVGALSTYEYSDLPEDIAPDIGGGPAVTNLDDLADVNAPTPTNGYALVWDSATSKWIPAAVSGGSLFADPNADRIAFWDDSAGAFTPLVHSAPLNITGTSLTIDAATTTANGSVELATSAETITGTDTVRAVTPAGLQAKVASETVLGIVELATAAEAVTGSSTSLAVHPSGLTATRGRYVGFNAQTGTTYTPVLTDQGKLVTCSNAAAITVTLPQDSSLAFPVEASIDFAVLGAGMVTFVAGAGATVNGTPSLVTRAQYSAVTAIKRAANTWLLVGDLA